jgi:hypothetical protein
MTKAVLHTTRYFLSSPGGNTAIMRGLGVFNFEQFYQILYRPELVRERLAGDPKIDVLGLGPARVLVLLRVLARLLLPYLARLPVLIASFLSLRSRSRHGDSQASKKATQETSGH